MKVNLSKIKKELKQKGFFSFIEKIEKTEPKAEIYLVGGAVRDLIMNRGTTDLDFIVRNVPAKKLESILTKLGKVNFVGKTFGVFKLNLKDSAPFSTKNLSQQKEEIDIALPRTDFAFNTGGRKDFKIKYNPKLKIEDDLSRRDFTINAMALRITNNKQQITNNKFIDPYDGLQDLNKKIIRTVGKPEERFREDYSRMLRGVRIACELEFSIEPKTWLAIKKHIKHLNDQKNNKEMIVPREVIAKELIKAFLTNPSQAFDFFNQAGIFKVLMPEVEKMKSCPQPKEFHSEGDVFVHTKMALKALFSPVFQKEFPKEKNDSNLIMALLFHDIGKPLTTQTPEKHGTDRIRANNHDVIGAQIADKLITKLKLSSPAKIGLEPKKVIWLIKNHLIMLHIKKSLQEVKSSTLEKYFFSQEMPSQDLLKLILADTLACRPKGLKGPILKDYYQLKKRLKKLTLLSKKKKVLPPPILNGHEIINLLKLNSSPKIGKIKEELRIAQLNQKIKNKKEAKKFLKRKYGN
ncbi:MAG: HD domain-containing protein [Bacteroidetes bacterium]|nr:HD domain-containing protein [Bacteroidota bacterium]